MSNLRKITKINSVAIIFIIVLSIFIGFIFSKHINIYKVEAEALSIEEQNDATILKYKRVPTLQDDFEDDKVIVILKSANSNISEIGLDFFSDEVSSSISFKSISNSINTVQNSDQGLLQLEPRKNQILTLELETKSKENVLKAINELEKLKEVLIAQPSYIYETETTWISSTSEYQVNKKWGLNDIQAEDAWNITKGNHSIRVGIMEDGFDVNHEDLNENILSLEGGFISSSGTDLSHGTHVAGIIGAEHNSVGIEGVSQASLTLLDGSYNNFQKSIEFAQKNNIKIINASFHFTKNGKPAEYDTAHATALSNYDGLFVASASNQGRDLDVNQMYPSCYDLPNVIAVGALDEDGTRRDSSNYGVNTVKLYAPGGNIYSTLPNNTYGYKSGTSMAAPYVTGVAALMLSVNPYLNGAELKSLILESADTITIDKGEVKKLNAFKAVSSVPPCDFEIKDGVITDFSKPEDFDGNLEIPFGVTGIAENVFLGDKDIVSVTISGNTRIGKSAFKNCENLTTVYVNSSDVLTLVDDAFAGCPIKWIVVPDACETKYKNATYWRNYSSKIVEFDVELSIIPWNNGTTYAIVGQSYVDEVVIIPAYYGGTKVTEVLGGFRECQSLTEIFIPSTVTRIGARAFVNCPNLTSMTLPFIGGEIDGTDNTHFEYIFGASNYSEQSSVIPSSLRTVNVTGGSEVAANAFYNCDGLTNITLPDGVTSIGANAFYNCDGLTNITLPDDVTSIGASAFYDCDGLTNITLPDNLTSIGARAFYDCDGLTNITLPDNVTSIGVQAFYDCDSLTSVTLPTNLTMIGASAFASCDKLNIEDLPESLISIGSYAFADCALTSVNLPEGLLEFGSGVFSGTDITSLSLPRSLEYISEEAFAYCTELRVVFVEKAYTTEEICDYRLESAFIGCENLQAIFVIDEASALAYLGELNYTEYADMIHCIGINSVLVTDIDDGSHLQYFYPHRFKEVITLYEFDDEAIDAALRGVLTETNDELGIEEVQEITSVVLYVTTEDNVYAAQGYNSSWLNVPDIVIVDVEEIYEEEVYYPVIARDYYSLGANIARTYLSELEGLESQTEIQTLNAIWEQLTYFPIISTEEWQNNAYFLLGMSNEFGVPVKVLTVEGTEIEGEIALISSEDLVFENWLIFDVCMEAEIVEIFQAWEMNMTNFYFFGYGTSVYQAQSSINNVYQIKDTAGYLNAIENGGAMDYEAWSFNEWVELDKWAEFGKDFFGYWLEEGYLLDTDGLTVYIMEKQQIYNEGWNAYWESKKICYVEQVVEKIEEQQQIEE